MKPLALAAGAQQEFVGTSAPAQITTSANIKRERLSPSQVNSWLDCRASYWFKYIVGLPDPPSEALAIGRALHDTARGYLAMGPEDRADFPLEDADAHLQRMLRIELESVHTRTKAPGELQALASSMLAVFLPAIAPLEVAQVEHVVSGTIAGVPLNGVVDVLTADGTIIDFKTAGRKPSGISGSHRRQIAIYKQLEDAHAGKLITITKTASPAVIEQTVLNLGAEVQHLERLLPIVAEDMTTGLYPPNRASLFCSRHNCAFWRDCQREFGGLVNE